MAKQRGRPIVTPQCGTRISLGLKVTAETKLLIDAAAKASGRTQSQEAEYRLQRSFDDDDIVARLLSAARSSQ